MAATQQMNQFAQLPLKGQVSMILSPNTISVQVDPTSVATIVAGDNVYLTGATANAVTVDKCANSTVGIGYVVYSPKIDKWTAGQMMEIGMPGTIINLEAGAPITRGWDLEFSAGASQVIHSAGTNPISGTALDNATGSGQIIRVLVKGTIALSITVTGGTINNTPIGQGTPNLGSFTTLFAAAASYTLDAGGAIVALTPGSTIALDSTKGNVFTLTPAQAETINVATVPTTGQRIDIVITTSGSTSYTITFGSGFKTTTTLATGGTNAKVFVISFISDGTNFNEVSRTTAM